MANNLVVNPMIFDSVMSSAYKTLVATTLGTLFTLCVEKILIENATVVGRVTFTDGKGITYYDVPIASTQVLEEDWTAHPRVWQDFQLTVLPAGALVYLFYR